MYVENLETAYMGRVPPTMYPSADTCWYFRHCPPLASTVSAHAVMTTEPQLSELFLPRPQPISNPRLSRSLPGLPTTGSLFGSRSSSSPSANSTSTLSPTGPTPTSLGSRTTNPTSRNGPSSILPAAHPALSLRPTSIPASLTAFKLTPSHTLTATTIPSRIPIPLSPMGTGTSTDSTTSQPATTSPISPSLTPRPTSSSPSSSPPHLSTSTAVGIVSD